MQNFTYPLLSAPSYTQSALLEARLRREKGVISACIAGTSLKLTVNGLSYLRATLLVSRNLGRALFASSMETVSSAGTLIRKKESATPGDVKAQLDRHKRQALASIAAFVAFALLKRVNPTLYASTALLRHLSVLSLSAGLVKEGLVGAVKERRPNADTLTVTAVLSSIAAGRPESSLSLLALSNFAETLTILAAQKVRQNIQDLVGLNEQEVWVTREDGTEVRVPIEKVSVGMKVAVHTGEKICVDGVVCHGEAAVDEAAITGESVPATKGVGDKVYAGSTIRLGEIEVTVERVGDDTSLSRIVHMVENAQNRRAPIQQYADRMATSLVPVSFIAAAAVYLATRDLQRVLNMLFIDFSCGLKLSTATAMSATISRAAREGILVKGGSFIESAAAIDTVILDKTGTITRGRPAITSLTCAPGYSEELLLKLAGGTEVHSTHPMAMAILDEARERGLTLPNHYDTRTVMARGMEGELCPFEGCEGGLTLVGSLKFMQERQVTDLDLTPVRKAESGSLIYVAHQGRLAGIIEVADPVRPLFKRAVNRLRHLGVEEIIMLTGDNEKTARDIASSLNLDGYKAEVLPEDKAQIVSQKQDVGTVLMVGDGINDAPALAYASIGVAMGKGCTDTAMETADVTISSEDPLKLPRFIELSRDTMRLVHQNFTVTILVNTAAMTLGALGVINPLVASVVHNASTLGVVANSVRVLLPKNVRSRR